MDLNAVLGRAVELGASDIHLKVGQPPVLRRDGQLGLLPEHAPLYDSDLEAALALVADMTPAKLSHFHETGELDIAYAAEGLPRFRVNGYRQRGSISFAFRVIPNEVPSFATLRLPKGVERLAEEHRGLVLVTGATGSGKTTTLAAVIDHINRTRRQHIVTIEDPIEILHSDQGCIVNQREVGLDTESFLAAIRRVLRQDPDVILIGELRDAETAETALKAAESGHLVFSTMHTVDAAETIGRMVEFFPAAKQEQIRSILAGVLRGVISQRLLPKQGGGRVAAVEVMVNNSRISDLIRESRAEEITDAIAEGQFFDMQTFSQALIELVVAGEVDRETAANASTNQHDFLVSLDQALKRKAAGVITDRPVSEAEPEPPKPGEQPDARPPRRRRPGRMKRLVAVAIAALALSGPAGADVFKVVPSVAPSAPATLPSAELPNTPGSISFPATLLQRPAFVETRTYDQLFTLWQRNGTLYGVPWQVLAAINKIESNFGTQHGAELRGRDRLDAVHAVHLGALGRRRRRRRDREPLEPRRRDRRRGPLSGRFRRRERHLARGLLVQPRAVVRRRGAAAGAVVRHRRPRRDVQRRPAAGVVRTEHAGGRATRSSSSSAPSGRCARSAAAGTRSTAARPRLRCSPTGSRSTSARFASACASTPRGHVWRSCRPS